MVDKASSLIISTFTQLVTKYSHDDFSIHRFGLSSAILYILWIFLISAGNFSWQGLILGLFVAGLIAFISSHHLTFLDHLKITPAMPLFILRYLGQFLLALLQANFDMARRVLSPQLPINPALVLVKTELKSPLGKLILANSITLTPGTLSVDVIEEGIQVHWVDSTPSLKKNQETDLEQATHLIAESFERHLREFIE